MKRITLFAGHYGSGKTNIAVNYAFKLRQQGLEVAVADLDIVNPYFRTKDSEKELKEAGIRLICSELFLYRTTQPTLICRRCRRIYIRLLTTVPNLPSWISAETTGELMRSVAIRKA